MTGQFIIIGNKVNGYALYLHLPEEFLRNFTYADRVIVGDSLPLCETWGDIKYDEEGRETEIHFGVLACNSDLDWVHTKLVEARTKLQQIITNLKTTYYYEETISLG